jgi:hypothetical protein
VSSGSGSVSWEEYLEKLKKLQQQSIGEAALKTTAAASETKSEIKAAAVNGNLSATEEKIARGADARSSGVKLVGPSGMSGGSDASMKWVKAIAEEDDDDDDSLVQTLEEYLEELEELREKEKASAKAVNANTLNLAEAVREKAV